MLLILLPVAAAIAYLAQPPLARPIHQPVIGEVYLPRWSFGAVPAAVVLHGSEGYAANTSRAFAAALAARGIAALALCYFGCPGRPKTLHHIEIDDVFRAIAYMDRYPGVKRGDVTLIGFSRGGELALLAAAYDREPRAVVAYYGAPFTVGSYPSGAPGAWMMSGVPFPTGMQIPVTRIRGPVLLFVGARDRIWPANYSRQVASELQAAGHPHRLVVFPDAGHGFDGPWRRVSIQAGILGGTLAGYNHASRASFADTITFIRGIEPAYAPGPKLPPLPGVPPAPPLPGRIATVTLPLLAALVLVWLTGVEPDARRSSHPWLVRSLEPPWTEWEALDGETQGRIARIRRALSWTFAVVGAICIFAPLIASLV